MYTKQMLLYKKYFGLPDLFVVLLYETISSDMDM